VKVYDLVIMGAGAAGFAAAIKASELTDGRLSILMVSAGKLGGTCVNVGCIPSKYLIEAAKQYHLSRTALFDGVSPRKADLDFRKLMNALRSFVESMRREKYENVLGSYGNVELVEGWATFTSGQGIKIASEDTAREIRFRKALIAVGSRPSKPSIKGVDEVGYYTTDSVWGLDSLPDRTLLIGGGAVGLEIGQALQRLGSQVTLVEVLDRILPNIEPEISRMLAALLEEEGMKIVTKGRVVELSRRGEQGCATVVTGEGLKTVEFDAMLLATGRTPNTDSLNLEDAGVATDGRGYVKVDETMCTTNPYIYAAGDCVSKKWMLETLSAREGVVAAANIVSEGSARMDYTAVPAVVFTEPQVGTVGMTEREVVEKFGACSCRVVGLEHVARARMTDAKGLAKIVVKPGTGEVLGVHVLSPYAAEYVTEAALYVRHGKTIADIIDTIHVFPTYAEAVKLCAQAFLRPLTRMSCCVE